jgi:hypothetical protein
LSDSTAAAPVAPSPIHFWYGPVQRFGHLGRAQRWINILGHIDDCEHIDSAVFSLNGSPERPLTLGCDLHRLARAGDFNIELSWEEVALGANELTVSAHSKTGESLRNTVQITVAEECVWPLPYAVDFSQIDDLQDAVQIVDGLWQLHKDGVRTMVPYYDRVLSMGDSSWSNYETTIRLTLHGFTPSEPGPPTYDVTHFGVAMRWRGHHSDGLQPSRQWYPLGAQGELLIKEDRRTCQWRILFDHFVAGKEPRYAVGHNELAFEKPFFVKTQVATLADGRSRYRFKQWREDLPEPIAWDVEGYEEDDYTSGALCLVPHNSDVTIHEVRIEQLTKTLGGLAARPGPGAIHFSAPVGGVYGASGQAFTTDCLTPNSRLIALQVNLGPEPWCAVRGLRLKIADSAGAIEQVSIGAEQGDWQPLCEVPENVLLVGISGASGWYLDAIQFHFSDGSKSPRYGGSGGDSTFCLQLNEREGLVAGRVRGLYGTAHNDGIETLGLIFDPGD